METVDLNFFEAGFGIILNDNKDLVVTLTAAYNDTNGTELGEKHLYQGTVQNLVSKSDLPAKTIKKLIQKLDELAEELRGSEEG